MDKSSIFYNNSNSQIEEIAVVKNRNNLLTGFDGVYDPLLATATCLHQLFETTAGKFQEQPAVQFHSHTLAYSELNKSSNKLARYLRLHGIGKGDYVGILLPRTPDVYIAMLGVLKAGAAYIPIDPKYPEERINFILENCRAKAVLTDSCLGNKVKSSGCLRILLDKDQVKFSDFPDLNLLVRETFVQPSDTAYVIYTSGTTGTPKGVKISHAAACNLVRAEGKIFGVKPEDKVFQGFSTAFDASVEEIWLAFYSGATLFVGTDEIMQSGTNFSHILEENRITVLSTVPTLLSMLSDDIPSLRLLILGGEVCPDELVKRWARPGRRMVNTYGPTETTVIATFCECHPCRKITIGRPVPNYSAYILDQDLEKVPAGKSGELCIGGLGLADGYMNLQEQTDKKFIVPSFPVNPDFPTRLYRTGDLCRINDEGEIEFLGRIDSQVKLRGFRIELSEIESQLLLCPGVQSAAVAVKNGFSGIQLLVAYVVPSPTIVFDKEKVKSQLRSTLAPFMVPNHFEVIDELPLLPSGKVDRAKLADPRFTVAAQEEEDISGVATPAELKILHVWRKLFAPNPVKCNDNFFELGGHSLFASRMISELRKDPSMSRLSVRDVYAYPTIRELAAHINNMEPAENAKEFQNNDKTNKKVSNLTYYTVAFLQVLSLAFFYGIATLFVILPFIIKHYISHISYSELIFLCLDGILFSYPLLLLLSVAFKWLMIGKFKEGTYPLWGFYYFRFWFVKKFVDITPLAILTGTPFISVYYRMMGAKIGKDVYLGSDRLRAFDLISVGSNASIAKEAHIMGYSIDNGMLRLGRISIADNCFVGARALLHENSGMEENSVLLELSMLPEKMVIPAGEVWRGSPAKLCPHVDEVWNNRKDIHSNPVSLFFRMGIAAGHSLALLFILLFPTLLLIPYSYAIYFFDIHDGLWATLLTIIPLTALYVLSFCLSTAALKWLILGKLKPGNIPLKSGLYIRKWIIDSLIAMSLLMQKSLYATLYLPPWLRLIGAKVGKRAEISTVNSICTDLLSIGDESFLADSVNVGAPVVLNGTMIFRNTQVGSRSFLGNSSVLPTGGKVEDGCLIGVLSITPSLPEDAEKKNTSWLGSPPMLLPNRQESPSFPEKYTFRPTLDLYILRSVIEFFKITLPFAIASILMLLFYNYAYALYKSGSYLKLFYEAPLMLMLVSISTVFFGWLFKVCLIGKYKPGAKPLWSTFVWRNEFVNSISENLVYPFFQYMLLGTPFAPWYFRIMGSKIGKRVFMETTEITEYDLVTIGDGSVLNYASTIQTHLFEDRVMKMSNVNIGKNCTIGSLSVVLYDTILHDRSRLQGLSLVMKGETLPEKTSWQGSPCQLQC